MNNIVGAKANSHVTEVPAGYRTENLALIFQEVLTVIVRLRSNRQAVSDAESFRSHIRGALQAAEQEALRRGYVQEDVRVAIFAIVAFLDESVLNSRNPIFADWPRKPLQEELFGVHVAGEIFFRNVERLLARNDSAQLGELLEIHLLCLLLGFRGRYSLGGTGELRSFSDSISEKLRRIRGPAGPIAPFWAPPEEPVPPGPGDRWVRRLMWGTGGLGAMALLLFLIFKVSLSSAASELQSILSQSRM